MRQELFANYIAQGLNQTEAAFRAGYGKGNRDYASAAGSSLAKQPIVAARIKALSQPKTPDNVSIIPLREAYVADLILLREQAREEKAWNAAIKAHELIGRVAGHYIERHETRDLTKEALSMTAQEQFDLLSRALARLAKETGLKPILELEAEPQG